MKQISRCPCAVDHRRKKLTASILAKLILAHWVFGVTAMSKIFSAALVAGSLWASVAPAAVLLQFSEVGDDVVASFSGSLNLTGLRLFTSQTATDGVSASEGAYSNGGLVDIYMTTGPLSWGGGGFTSASANNGDFFTINGSTSVGSLFAVKAGYTSSTSISGGSVFLGQSLASLGLNTGTYEYTLPNDRITVQIGPSAVVPLPAAGLLLLGGLGALTLMRRKQG